MSRTRQVRARFRRIHTRLSAADLLAGGREELTLDDLGLSSWEERTDLLFGTYSRQGLEQALRAYGTLQRIEARGVGPLELRLELGDPYQPRLLLWSQRYRAPAVDISLRRTTGSEVGLEGALAGVPVLYLDQFILQHPGRSFDWSRPPLPDQRFPGLTLSAEILELLILMSRRVGTQALALTPATFHAAWVYERYFQFVAGSALGQFLALRRAGKGLPRWLLAWAVEFGCVCDPDGLSVRFQPSPMIASSHPPIARLLSTRAYRAAAEALARLEFFIDDELLRARFPWSRMPPGPPPEPVAELLLYDPLAV